MTSTNTNLTLTQQKDLLEKIEKRFVENNFTKDIKWDDVNDRLLKKPVKLWSLYQMEVTGGEPALVSYRDDEYIFFDTVNESPLKRRGLCYDDKALNARKNNKPKDSVISMCDKMQIELMTETDYAFLQGLKACDKKTSSWLKTPTSIRDLGGALFGDYRYGKTFIYHNGAQSYYSSRGFRGYLKV
ncbi:MAG: DUF4256 domain-containing protein [Erysipelothrix sp.]|nr:DUF4256 domain-containing protein [Erysipelothrix sp.]